MCLRGVGGGENRGGRDDALGGPEQSVQRGVGQLCQSPDSPPASPVYSAETREEEQEEGTH